MYPEQDTLDGMFNPVPDQQGQPELQQNGQDSWTSDLFGEPSAQPEQSFDPLNPQINETQKPDNNQVRASYFQSQYDKERNANQELMKRVAELEAQMKYVPQQVQNQPLQNTSPQEPVQTFPTYEEFLQSNPEPQVPYDMNDPEKMASYIREKAEFDKRNTQYFNLRNQYMEATYNEKLANTTKQINETKQQYEERMAYEASVNGVINDLQAKHGFTRDMATDFVKTMSDNNNFSLDNMVQYYRIAKGTNTQPIGYQSNGNMPYQQPMNYQPAYGNNNYNPPVSPSGNWQQYQRAQSIPNPMGVSGSINENVQESPMRQLIKNQIQTERRQRLMFGN